MILTDDEKALLNGDEGPARQKALEFLIKYGEAVGAERFVETNNVCSAVNAGLQFIGKSGDEFKSIDELFSEFYRLEREILFVNDVTLYFQAGIFKRFKKILDTTSTHIINAYCGHTFSDSELTRREKSLTETLMKLCDQIIEMPL